MHIPSEHEFQTGTYSCSCGERRAFSEVELEWARNTKRLPECPAARRERLEEGLQNALAKLNHWRHRGLESPIMALGTEIQRRMAAALNKIYDGRQS